MNNSLETDLLGYLIVLDDKTTLSYLTDGEKSRGRGALMGCLSRLTDHLEAINQVDSHTLLQMIKMREAINCDLRSQKEDFQGLADIARQNCASAVFEYYKRYFRAG